MLADPRYGRLVLINPARGEPGAVSAGFGARWRESLELLPGPLKSLASACMQSENTIQRYCLERWLFRIRHWMAMVYRGGGMNDLQRHWPLPVRVGQALEAFRQHDRGARKPEIKIMKKCRKSTKFLGRKARRARLGCRPEQGRARMAGAFDFKIDSNGARIVVARLPLTPDCTDDDAIDAVIEALKHDLDAVAPKMKAAVRRQARRPQAAIIPLPPRPI
jgi:hypothetical protein